MLIQPPKLAVDTRGHFRLSSPMVYRWEEKRETVTVPAGTRTDFATIPRPLRLVIQVNGRHRLAAVLHDYLYSKGGSFPSDRGGQVEYTRAEADAVFYKAMRDDQVAPWKALAMFSAVRACGFFFWKPKP